MVVIYYLLDCVRSITPKVCSEYCSSQHFREMVYKLCYAGLSHS